MICIYALKVLPATTLAIIMYIFRENGPHFWTQTIIALGFVKHVVAQQIIVNSQIGMLSRYEILQHDKNNSHKCSLLDHDYISWQQK